MLFRRLHLALAAIACLAASSTVQAGSIGINFSGGSGGPSPNSLAHTEIAGLVAQPWWNNDAGATGKKFPLVDNTGTVLTPLVSVTYASHDTSGLAPANPSNSNDRLLSNWLNGGHVSTPATVTVTNVPYSTYDVIIYTNDSITTNADYTVNGSTKHVTVGGNEFYSTHGWVADPAAGSAHGGNYVEFFNVKGSTLSVAANSVLSYGDSSSPVDAIQIVQTTSVPEPASLTLLGLGAAALLGYGARRRTALDRA